MNAHQRLYTKTFPVILFHAMKLLKGRPVLREPTQVRLSWDNSIGVAEGLPYDGWTLRPVDFRFVNMKLFSVTLQSQTHPYR